MAQYVPNPSGDLLDTVTRLQDSMMAFTAAYLNLEDAENNENNQFTTVSNVLKTKHDTVKNSIGNVR